MAKALILFSGGLDSTTVLAIAKDRGYEISALSFNYGQQNRFMELRAQALLEYHYEFKTRRVDLYDVWRMSKSKALIFHSRPTADAEDKGDDLTYKQWEIESRNAVFLAVAHAIACQTEADFIGIGLKRSEFPDSSPQFANLMDSALHQGSQTVYGRIWTPLIHMDRKQVVAEARRLDVPIEDTWSCYFGGPEPCGVCGACVNRQDGFG